jgi:hypothetical protein
MARRSEFEKALSADPNYLPARDALARFRSHHNHVPLKVFPKSSSPPGVMSDTFTETHRSAKRYSRLIVALFLLGAAGRSPGVRAASLSIQIQGYWRPGEEMEREGRWNDAAEGLQADSGA